MTATSSRARGAHLVGSVPLRDAEEVFRTASEILGPQLRRLTDGETGERSQWIGWQFDKITATPGIERTEPVEAGAYGRAAPRARLAEGVEASDVTFGPLGYAEVARQSYESFTELRRDGVIPDGTQFQVSLPSPLGPMTVFIANRDEQLALEPAYERRVLQEIKDILTTIPPGDLAIQWDVVMEIALLEGIVDPPLFADAEHAVIDRLVRLGQAVPSDVALGYHLCYGDRDHQHFKEPTDMAILVWIANTLTEQLARPLSWIHMPVPRDRDDDAYFAPLADLKLGPATELYLGLCHRTDGVEGTQKRIAAAQRVVSEFGVATECGFGRRPPETVPELLRIHATVADPIR